VHPTQVVAESVLTRRHVVFASNSDGTARLSPPPVKSPPSRTVVRGVTTGVTTRLVDTPERAAQLAEAERIGEAARQRPIV